MVEGERSEVEVERREGAGGRACPNRIGAWSGAAYQALASCKICKLSHKCNIKLLAFLGFVNQCIECFQTRHMRYFMA